MEKVFSGIQPTGDLHLGNYLGAIANWKRLQSDYDCTFCVVDDHAITAPYQASKLRQNSWKMTFQLLACGIDESNLFIQSMVPEHTELCWILSSVCAHGELSRMTQFKDKSQQIQGKSKESFISAGLFFYPVLQAADILLYKAKYVPVGKDQEQHLELSRNIAQRFNNQFGKEYFAPPEPLFTSVPKVYSMADPSRKMSKSLGEKHCVNLFGEENKVRKQVKSAITDSGDTPNGSISPGVKNLLVILKEVSIDTSMHDQFLSQAQDGSLKYSELKEELADELWKFVAPIKDRFEEIQGNKKAYKERIKESARAKRKVAQETLLEVRELVGMSNPVRV